MVRMVVDSLRLIPSLKLVTEHLLKLISDLI